MLEHAGLFPGPHPEDPANVTATRQAEEQIMQGWIEAFAAEHGSHAEL